MKVRIALVLGVIALIAALSSQPLGARGEVCSKYCGCGEGEGTAGHRSATNCSLCHVVQCPQMAGYCQGWNGPFNDDCNGHVPCWYISC